MGDEEYKGLAAQAANGNAAAFSRLYSAIYREMYYTAYYSLANEGDAVEVITATYRDGFSAVGKLKNADAFRAFMMKTLCARIKEKFKEYSETSPDVPEKADGYDVKYEFGLLTDGDRLVGSMYIGGKFRAEEIAAFTGYGSASVKSSIERVVSGFALD